MNILDILSPAAIRVPLVSSEKQAVIEELVDVLAAESLVGDADELKDVVWAREQQRSTGIGEGLAIPHGKSNTLTELVIAMGRAGEPLEFDAIDRKPVQLVVLLASPPDRTSDHIQALGKISRLMANQEFRWKAYNAESAEDLYNLFAEAEGARA